MNTSIKISLAVIASMAFIPVSMAQSDSNVYNERVVVTSRYKPVVEETQKINKVGLGKKKGQAPQGPRYSSYKAIMNAKTIDELWE